MTKKLYPISVIYDVVVVADESETAEYVAGSHIQDIVENEKPRYVNIGALYKLFSNHIWYDTIPYGDADGKPAQYYTTEEIKKRESGEEVVKKVKDMLTADEWDALKVLMSEGVE